MIKIELSDEIKKKHLKYFEDNIIKNFDDVIPIFTDQINKDAHYEFMKYCKTNKEILAIGKPEKLRKFVKEMPKAAEQLILQNPECSCKQKKVKNYNEFLLYLFGYEKFCHRYYDFEKSLTIESYEQNKSKLKNNWTPYDFLMMSKIRVCPYCNRQYITPIYIQSKKNNVHHRLRADLDHFYPKSKYPYLSMSLYNLVPCCKSCNSSLKNTMEFDIYDINPYEESFDDYFKFKTDILNDAQIYIEYMRPGKKIDKYLKCFQLKTLYNYHRNQAKELMQKRVIYSESYIDELYNNNKSYFKSKQEIKELIIGYICDKKDIDNEAFSKFRRDIAEQLHFIDCSIDEGQLKELKKIISK